MNKKYEFTGVTKQYPGTTLHQIRALVTIVGVVSAGDVGVMSSLSATLIRRAMRGSHTIKTSYGFPESEVNSELLLLSSPLMTLSKYPEDVSSGH